MYIIHSGHTLCDGLDEVSPLCWLYLGVVRKHDLLEEVYHGGGGGFEDSEATTIPNELSLFPVLWFKLYCLSFLL